jgi:ubiquinone/menaquinone biosynthesis C-methylase UbiE
MHNPQTQNTSWDAVGGWYNELVGKHGQYYHQHVVLPKTIRLLKLGQGSSLVDFGCGNGILARGLPKNVTYTGIDSARSLVQAAQGFDHAPNHTYRVADCTKPMSVTSELYTHATILLALQNMKHPHGALQNAAKLLEKNGTLVIVLNHPCFRIPRQSGWGVREQNTQQYRWINRYRSALEIPITMHPGQGPTSPVTWTFHRSLSEYSEMLSSTGFVMEKIEEWYSDKKSEGRVGRSENFARNEIPLFLAIAAKKLKVPSLKS